MKVLGKRNIDLFSDVPGPSPWYLRGPVLGLPGFEWVSAGNKDPHAGKTLLVDRDGKARLILDFQNYAFPLSESALLVWNQYPRGLRGFPSPPVKLNILDPDQLAPLDLDLVSACERMTAADAPLLFTGEPSAVLDLSTTIVGETLSASFPGQLSGVGELLILCHSSGIDADPGYERNNLALMVVRPSESCYVLHAQDWYNSGGFDYGYQWVTRVARDRTTQAVHGEGVRIQPFVLDQTLRALK